MSPVLILQTPALSLQTTCKYPEKLFLAESLNGWHGDAVVPDVRPKQERRCFRLI